MFYMETMSYCRLTSFVIRIFGQAQPYLPDIDMSESIIRAAEWMVQKQSRDGSFPEVGTLHHKAMQVERDSQLVTRTTGLSSLSPRCRAASVLPLWNSRCKIKLIFGVMLQFNVVWCIHSRREIVLTIQSDNGKQGYKVGGKKYLRPKVVLSQRPLRTV